MRISCIRDPWHHQKRVSDSEHRRMRGQLFFLGEINKQDRIEFGFGMQSSMLHKNRFGCSPQIRKSRIWKLGKRLVAICKDAGDGRVKLEFFSHVRISNFVLDWLLAQCSFSHFRRRHTRCSALGFTSFRSVGARLLSSYIKPLSLAIACLDQGCRIAHGPIHPCRLHLFRFSV